jgi:hypothetical protein
MDVPSALKILVSRFESGSRHRRDVPAVVFGGRWDDVPMISVGVLARFETKPNSGGEMAAFFREGLPFVAEQPETTMWFAFCVNKTTYGAFAAFADDRDRDALLSSGGPQLAKKYGHLFTSPPTFDKVDLLEARIAYHDNTIC